MDRIYIVSYSLEDDNKRLRDIYSVHKTAAGAAKSFEDITSECDKMDGYVQLSKTNKIAEYRINSRPINQRLTIYINPINLQS